MKKVIKYILTFIIGFFGAGIAFSGLLGIFENIIGQVNFSDLLGDVLTVVIGLFLLFRVGLSPFKKKKVDLDSNNKNTTEVQFP